MMQVIRVCDDDRGVGWVSRHRVCEFLEHMHLCLGLHSM